MQRKNNFTDDAGVGAARVYVWHILARIKLSHLSDFFEKMPLVKSPYLQITVSYNSSVQTVTYTNAGTLVTVNTPTITGNTNPLMIASAAAKNPLATAFSATNRTQTFACGIYTATDGTNSRSNTLLSSCQIVMDAYTMTPTAEREFISTIKEKDVDFTDLQYQLLQNQSGSIQTLVTGGLKRAKRLIIIPYYTRTANTGLTTVPVYQSPFTSEPATPSPLAALTNLQIQVSGVNLWTNAVDYTWDMYKNEVSSAYALEGGQGLGITSGLLSQQDWEIGYRYIVADLSRRFSADDDTAKSIQVSATISSARALDLLIFVEYERTVTVDTSTSAVKMVDL